MCQHWLIPQCFQKILLLNIKVKKKNLLKIDKEIKEKQYNPNNFFIFISKIRKKLWYYYWKKNWKVNNRRFNWKLWKVGKVWKRIFYICNSIAKFKMSWCFFIKATTFIAFFIASVFKKMHFLLSFHINTTTSGAISVFNFLIFQWPF
jgi:hypothetical protein